jgi:N-acetylglucosamine kinase-like BadF-type ATPase
MVEWRAPGGWGELFSDEGSAYWIAREGLNLFSRMSDGRTPRGALYDTVRRHFDLQFDLDLCAAIYDQGQMQRSHLATLSMLIAQAATAGDAHASALFSRAAFELAQIVDAVHRQLEIPEHATVPVSYSGGMFQERDLLLARLQSKLTTDGGRYRVVAPRLPPAAGAALYAAKLSGAPLVGSGGAAGRTENRGNELIVLAENGLQLILRQRLHNPIVRADHRLGGD